MKKFWIVMKGAPYTGHHFRFTSETDAKKRAQKCAASYGGDWYVFGLVGLMSSADPSWNRARK